MSPNTAYTYRLSATEQVLYIDSISVRLTTQEVSFVAFLMKFQGKVCTPRMIFNDLYSGQPRVAEKILDVIICKIRKKMRHKLRGADKQIRTVWGRGYAWGMPMQAQTKHPLLEDIERWTPFRKADVVEALREGKLRSTDVTGHYPDFTYEELFEWMQLFTRHNTHGLHATKSLVYAV